MLQVSVIINFGYMFTVSLSLVLSSELSLIAACIFEGIVKSLKCNIRYILHQIQQKRHDDTECKIASSE